MPSINDLKKYISKIIVLSSIKFIKAPIIEFHEKMHYRKKHIVFIFLYFYKIKIYSMYMQQLVPVLLYVLFKQKLDL